MSSKMTYLREISINPGVVSIHTTIREGRQVITWRVSCCSPKDQFSKKIAKDLCVQQPVMEGRASLNSNLMAYLSSRDLSVSTYITGVVLHDIANMNALYKKLPKYALDLLYDAISWRYM